MLYHGTGERNMGTAQIEQLITISGGVFRGIQKGYPELGIESIVLFDGPKGSIIEHATMSLELSRLTQEAVKKAIQRKEVEFSKH